MQTSIFFLISLLIAAPLGVPAGLVSGMGKASSVATAGAAPGVFKGTIKPLLMKQDTATLVRLAADAEKNGHSNAGMLRAAANLKTTGNREGIISHGIPVARKASSAVPPAAQMPFRAAASAPIAKTGLSVGQKVAIGAGVVGAAGVIGGGIGGGLRN